MNKFAEAAHRLGSVLQASETAQVFGLSEPHSIILGRQQTPKQVGCCHPGKEAVV